MKIFWRWPSGHCQYPAGVFPLLLCCSLPDGGRHRGVVWSFGTLDIFGYKITLLTSLIAPLIIVIGMSQLHPAAE
jgi:hypothetical protein